MCCLLAGAAGKSSVVRRALRRRGVSAGVPAKLAVQLTARGVCCPGSRRGAGVNHRRVLLPCALRGASAF